jgi:hypothetical protein
MIVIYSDVEIAVYPLRVSVLCLSFWSLDDNAPVGTRTCFGYVQMLVTTRRFFTNRTGQGPGCD